MTSPAHTALADQLAAAANDAEATLRRAIVPSDTLTTIKPNPWLNEQYTALRIAVLNGTARACPHIAEAPAVAHVAVWRRWLLTCGPCSPLLTPDPIQASTCDHCHRYGRTLTDCTVVLGPILLSYNVCGPCMRHLHPLPGRTR